MSLSYRATSPVLFVGFLIKIILPPQNIASRILEMLMTGLRKILQLDILMIVSNKEEKAHTTVNETFQNGNALSGSGASCSLFLLLCEGILLLLGLSTIIDDLYMDSLLASSRLPVKSSSQSPAVDIVLFCLLKDTGGPLGSI